jgi:hypothetical protein
MQSSTTKESVIKLDNHLRKIDIAYKELFKGLILDSDVIYTKNNLPWYNDYYLKYSKFLNYWNLIDEILKLQALLILQKSFNNMIKKQINNTLLNGYIQFASSFWVEESSWYSKESNNIPNKEELIKLYKDLCNEIISIRLWLNLINDTFLIYRNENPRGLEFLKSFNGKSLRDLMQDYRNIVFNDNDNNLNNIIQEEFKQFNFIKYNSSFPEYYLELLKILLEYFVEYSNDYLLSLQ